MDQKQQIAEKLKQANNILVTVSNNPTVDQLASCIGLTLALGKMGKHTTAVFSGTVPSIIEFLEPEKTLENNVDSLRDFIISLDKNKADKLRYKVEDTVVKIFITPYHTSLGDKDLEFSQGDFNVDAVVALGVHTQGDIDQAIAAHGRILHDAAVVAINITPGGEVGSLNWLNPAASSLCELVADLVTTMDKQALDGQISTALLTGIVAETNRFSNNKTSPATMSISATLMAAGANQQLVVSKLEQAVVAPPIQLAQTVAQELQPGELQIRQPDSTAAANIASQPSDGTLSVGGGVPKPEEDAKPIASLEDLAGSGSAEESKEAELSRIHIDAQGGLHTLGETAEDKDGQRASTDPTVHMVGSRMILQPPSSESGGGTALGIPGAADSAAELPSGAPMPAPGPGPSPFAPSAPASGGIPSAQPAPLMPPNVGTAAPAPAASPAPPMPSAPPAPSFNPVPAPVAAPAGLAPAAPMGALSVAPSHVDNARSAVMQAFGPTVPQPGLAAPTTVGAPVAPANLGAPAPLGPPPPVPPPMVPSPQ